MHNLDVRHRFLLGHLILLLGSAHLLGAGCGGGGSPAGGGGSGNLCIVDTNAGLIRFCSEYVGFTETLCAQSMGVFNSQCPAGYVGYCQTAGNVNPRRTYVYGSAIAQQAAQSVCPGGTYVPGNGTGSGATGAGGAAGVGGSRDSGAGGAGGVTACTTLTLTGNAVTEIPATGTAPAPAGGIITDGTYRMTRIDVYSPEVPLPYRWRLTLRIAGNKMEQIVEQNASVTDANYEIATAGANLMLVGTCPTTPYSSTVSYTATPTTIMLFARHTAVRVYTKQ